MDTLTDLYGEVISQYTRRQAMDDGVLVEMPPEMCRELGFRVPVAATAAVWAKCCALTPAAERACNDIEGRTWDVLYMLKHAIRCNKDTDTIRYELRCVVDRITPSRVWLKALCHGGDNAEPVITIMLPDED